MGRVVRALNADSDLRFDYDRLGRVVTEACNGRVLSSAYDSLGRRTRRRTPSGSESSWEYSVTGQPTTLHAGGQTVQFRRDAAGRELQRTIGSRVALTQTWDTGHRLTNQSLWKVPESQPTGQAVMGKAPAAQNADLLQHRAYQYRADGYITGIHEQTSGTRRFDINPTGRVTAVHGRGWTERYAYDQAGNLTKSALSSPHMDTTDETGVTGELQYTGTLIRRSDGVRYEYDAQGRSVFRQQSRLSSKPFTWRYYWDADDRLVGVKTPDGNHWRYYYDAFGRRISKRRFNSDGRSVAEQIDFVWDGALLAERAQAIQSHSVRGGAAHPQTYVTAWEWEPGTFRPVSQTERMPLRDAPQQWVDEQFYAIISDAVGTPTEMVDSSGSVRWKALTTLWGERLSGASESVSCPLRFPGQYYDSETGLHYNYQRYYDPHIGRYISGDPIGLTGGPNQNAYASNPLRWFDFLGLKCAIEDLKKLSEEDREKLLSRVRRGDKKGRPFGSPRNPRWPTLEEFRPRWEDVRAGDLGHEISSRMHGLFPEQVHDISKLANHDLTKVRLEDPISAVRGPGGLDLTGGHHRTAAIVERVAGGSMSPDELVRILVHD